MGDTTQHRIVSPDHLAEGDMGGLSELEFGLIVAHNAFARWVQRCMAAAGHPELGVLETLVLHHVNHRGRDKRLSDICFLLNIEDVHTVNYALKKLRGLGLVGSRKQGKEAFYSATEAGQEACRRYAEIRRLCLLDGLPDSIDTDRDLTETGARLRRLSGQYDQASRATATL